MILLTGFKNPLIDFSLKMRTTTFRKAFSLIELLLVIIIISIVLGLAVPNLAKGQAYFKLKQEAKNIAYVMKYAQQRAVIDNATYQLMLDLGNQKYWLMKKGSESQAFEKFTGRLAKVFRIPSDIILESEQQEVEFYPNGTMSKTEFYLSSEKNKIAISTKVYRGKVYVYEEQ